MAGNGKKEKGGMKLATQISPLLNSHFVLLGQLKTKKLDKKIRNIYNNFVEKRGYTSQTKKCQAFRSPLQVPQVWCEVN